MPINFNTLVHSEENLRKLFLKYYEHVIYTHEELAKTISKTTKISEQTFRKFKRLEKICNDYEAKLLDEASWVISKDMPRAAHLRFLIAILRSIKDLERMGDFAFNVVKYFHSWNVEVKIAQILGKVANESLSVVKVFFKNLSRTKQQTRRFYNQTATKTITEFGISYKQHFKELGKTVFESNMRLDANTIGAFTAAKNLERNADHAFNIIENFTYITEGDFYFTKESRKDI